LLLLVVKVGGTYLSLSRGGEMLHGSPWCGDDFFFHLFAFVRQADDVQAKDPGWREGRTVGRKVLTWLLEKEVA
jgi:hypothetical protein